jgi:outer membrane lipoprotein-sorting protein
MTREPIEPEDIERMFADESDSLPPEVEARMRVHLETLHAKIDGASTPSDTSKESWIMSIVRNLKTGRARWGTAAVFAVIAFALLYAFSGGGPGSASYAAVAERLRSAKTLCYKGKSTAPNSPVPSTTMSVYFMEPGLLRMETQMEMRMGTQSQKVESVMVSDNQKGKAIGYYPASRQYVLMSLPDLPMNDLTRASGELRKLPAKADEAMFGELDGRRVRIYLADEEYVRKTLWIDDATGELVHYVMEYPKDKGGMRIEMSDFQFDPTLDPKLFSIEPPAGYQPLSAALKLEQPGEQHLLAFLRFYTDEIGRFPAILDPSRPTDVTRSLQDEAMKLAWKGRKTGSDKESKDKVMQDSLQFTNGLMFVLQMQPGNDFHYAGANIKPGNAADWICWWKPTGATKYRVLHGDLTLGDATEDEATAHSSAH